MFLKRNYSPEIMDDFSIQDERIDSALNELKLVNKYLGGKRASNSAIKKISEQKTNKNNLKILDLGSGGADDLHSKKFVRIDLTSLDRNKRACFFLKRRIDSKIICADAFNLPFKKKYFDIVHASLFLHHFTKKEIVKILTNSESICNNAIVINDLRRSFLAYAGIKILTSLFSKSNMVKNDGPLSVKKGFVRSELKKIIHEAGFKNYSLKRKWAFRWLVIIYL
jgi:ubiquinone/menaquinone biosynthesis C-methylase UbiE